MIQKTTPTLTFTVSDFDLSSYDVYVYITQRGVEITKEPTDLTVTYSSPGSTVEATLTETDTLSLMQGSALAQIWATNGTDSVACEALPFTVSTILNTEIPE